MTTPRAPLPHKKRGSPPAPRYTLAPEFMRAARSRPLWMLASWCGRNDANELSKQFVAGRVTGTPLQIERMLRIADALHFPRERVFVEPLPEPEPEYDPEVMR